MLQHASSLPNRYPVSWNLFFSCDGWTIMLESCKEHVNLKASYWIFPQQVFSDPKV